MEGYAYFPAIVYRDERPDLLEKVLPICKQYLDQARQPNTMLVQSNNLNSEPLMQDVVNYLLVSAADILRGQGYSIDRYDFYISGLWAQELKANYGTDVHVHKNSQICGWIFLETPTNGAYPIYHDCRMNKAMVELDFVQDTEITNATKSIHFNNMQPGTILFSNSWMQHQLVGGQSESPTKCIHFIVSHKERSCSI